jgi:hypothetical protein
MKNRELEAIWRKVQIQDLFPTYVLKWQMVHDSPVGDVFRGVFFDRSADKKMFYVIYFFFPMFIPTEGVHFSFGDRLRNRLNRDGWFSDDPNLIEELRHAILNVAKPFFDSVNDLDGVIAHLQRRRVTGQFHLRLRENLAASFARRGRLSDARAEWIGLLAMIDNRVEWHTEMAQRVTTLQDAFARSPAEGQAQLDAWAAETRANLKLPA